MRAVRADGSRATKDDDAEEDGDESSTDGDEDARANDRLCGVCDDGA